MANTNGNSSWEKIQSGVKETERMIGQRDYNSAMIKARQTLEFMVKQLLERAAIIDNGDLKQQIDILYENQWISKATCEHYHKIRMIGNKAAHEGDTSAYNANQAYHMLSQEVYTFANNHSNAQKGSRVKPANRTAAATGRTATSGQTGSRSASRSDSPNEQTGRNAAQSARGVSSVRNSQARHPVSSANRSSRKRQQQKHRGFTTYDLLKLLIPVLCIVLLFFVVKLFKPGKDDTKPSKEQVNTEASVPTTDSESTDAPVFEQEAAVTYKATTTLNVRKQPNTDSERLGKLAEGEVVDYVGVHDADWAIILFEGQEAYVASQYLTTE